MGKDWIPALQERTGTIHDRLLTALEHDIDSGKLKPGDRLPSHRELAHRLGIGIGTVTKAYVAAERRGLLVSRVGSGTIVADIAGSTTSNVTLHPSAAEMIDLTLNLPPLTVAAERLAETLARLRRNPSIHEYATFAPHAGFERDRRAAAAWLERTAHLEGADWHRLLLCTGAQHAMSLALEQICRPGDVVMTEAATFHGMKSLAEYRGYRLVGLPMDEEGLLPEALDRAAASGISRVVYTQPTLHNPTARTMTPARRNEIVSVARRHNLWILEGDIYAALAWCGEKPRPNTVPVHPIAHLAPERTFYASSMSKALAPGLRAGFLIVPDREYFEKVWSAIRATCYAASALGPLVATQWIEDGTADEIIASVIREASTRTALAERVLGAVLEKPSHPASFHVWIPLPEAEAEQIAGRALRQRVVLTPPSASLIDAQLISGIRLCLGTAPNRAALQRALDVVATLLSSNIDDRSRSVV